MPRPLTAGRNLGPAGRFGLLAILGALLLPTAAVAQGIPYEVLRFPHTYELLPIPGGAEPVVLSPSSADNGQVANHPLPFPVQFFGVSYSRVNISTNVFVSFTGTATTSSNAAIPATATPNQIIAPWWDNAECMSGQLRSQLIGTAPRRHYVIQWQCEYYLNAPNDVINTQLWFTENSPVIEVRYGTATGSSWDGASIGIEGTGQPGTGFSPLTCSPNCPLSQFPTNSALVYSQGPDLTPTAVRPPSLAWAGVTARLEADAFNLGALGTPAGAAMRFWVSTDKTLSGEDFPLGISEARVMDARQSAVFSLDAPMPSQLAPGEYYLLAEIDPLNSVLEVSETNNVFPSDRFVIGDPLADLRVESIVTPVRPQRGVPFTLEWTVRNAGNQLITNIPYAVVLSSNDLISPSETRIATGTVSVGALASAVIRQEVTIPDEILYGTYWIGIVLDPDHQLVEIDELNNIGVSPSPFDLRSNELSIPSTFLPATMIGATSCATLLAEGGNGTYSWSLASGTMPPDFHLEEERSGDRLLATQLCGTASAVGSFPFTLRVESAGLLAFGDYELTVHATGAGLEAATFELPAARVGERYDQALFAVGGTTPYEWSRVSGDLPPGIRLLAAGALQGVPEIEGTFPFRARVRDHVGAEAFLDLELVVDPPARTTCMTLSLPSRHVGEAFDDMLHAAGGEGGYTWTTTQSMRLEDSLDPGEPYGAQPPTGLTLHSSGHVSGTPAMAGSYQWYVQVRDADGGEDSCAVSFDVTYDQGITVVTTALGAAYVDVPYSVALEVTGGKPPYVWWTRPDSNLPDGLTLSADGVLSGKLAPSLLDGKPEKVLSFTAIVRDDQNRLIMAPLSIKLLEKKPEPTERATLKQDDEGGCQTGFGDPGLALLAAGLGLLALRRRG